VKHLWFERKTRVLPGWQGRLGPLVVSWEPGFGWFRLFGVGLSWKDSKRHGLLFSERNSYRRRLRIGSWGVGMLK
jgi:hypothetical protein